MSEVRVLKIYSMSIELEAADAGAAEVCEKLVRDFEAFGTPLPKVPPVTTKISMTLKQEAVLDAELARELAELRFRRRLFRTRMCDVYGFGKKRVCDYGDGTVLVARNEPQARAFSIRSAKLSELHEVAYMALLSAVGECLDLKGLHRVHGLGLVSGQSAILMIGACGAGKSALAVRALRQGGFTIFSDESPLVHSGAVYPFPIRMALAPSLAKALGEEVYGERFERKCFPEKALIPIPQGQVASAALPVSVLILLSQGNTSARVEDAGKGLALWELLKWLVVGLGVAQMAEHLLRGDLLIRLIRVAASRLREALTLLRQARVYRFSTGWDAHENYEVFKRIIQQ